MPISTEHVGRTWPATPGYEVTRVKVAEFSRALADLRPLATEPVVPPTFAVVIASAAWDVVFADPDLGLELRRIVHGDQSFTWTRPLRVGDEVTATAVIESVRLRGPMEFVGLRVDLATTAGEPLCEARSTLVHTRQAS